MPSVTRVPPEIRAEAAAWLARLRADDRNPSDERAFRAWIAQDPQHVRAFEAVTEAWEAAGAVRPEFARAECDARPRFVTRRRALVAGVSTLAVAGAFIALEQQAYASVYETAVGEQKHVVLPDGTQAFLDTDTRIRAVFGDDTRTVDLDRGRCDFNVAKADSRPFLVNADAWRILTGQAVFDVQRDGEDVAVVVLQGGASVSGVSGAPRNPCLLGPGERLVTANGRVRLDRPNLGRVLAWQTGQAVFENDALADAIREMNHYSVVKLEAGDPAVARLRISGVYHVGDNVAFARSVAALLPVIPEVGMQSVRLVPDPARARKDS